MPFRLMLGVWDFVGVDMFLDTLWTFMFIHTLCNNDVIHFDSSYDVIDIAY